MKSQGVSDCVFIMQLVQIGTKCQFIYKTPQLAFSRRLDHRTKFNFVVGYPLDFSSYKLT